MVNRALLVLVVFVAALIAWAPTAEAHTAFESSNPADGSTLDLPVGTITITFTGASEPAGDGFQVLTPDGLVVEPVVEVSDDQRTFSLTVEPAITNGIVGVRWSVRAGDAHPIDGSFSFTTTAPSPTPVPVPTPTTAPTPPPALTPSELAETSEAVETTPLPEAPATATPAPVPTPEPEAPVAQEPSTEATTGPVELDAFLRNDDSVSTADVVGFAGRALAIGAALLAAGASVLILAIAPTLLSELRSHRWVAVAAVVVVVGAVLEGASFLLDDASDVLTGQAGVALGLRLFGAASIGVGSFRQLRWVQLAGCAAVLVSFLFDGHTVTEGNRLATAIADLSHVAAAATWVGGIAVLLVVANSANPSLRSQLAPFAAHFSVVAPVAVAFVAVAGIALAVTIIDTFSDVWTTTWGRSLLAKTAVVGLVLGLGAYNHFRLVPSIEGSDQEAAARLARTLRIELGLLAVVGAITAALVAAATS